MSKRLLPTIWRKGAPGPRHERHTLDGPAWKEAAGVSEFLMEALMNPSWIHQSTQGENAISALLQNQ